MSELPLVSVVIVTYNSEADIRLCLESVTQQSHPRLEVVVIDNDSSDRTEEELAASGARFRYVKNPTNRGFAAAHNQGIRVSRGEYYLALNPDVELSSRFVEEVVKAATIDPMVGSVTGKLLRRGEGEGPGLIDSTGIYMIPSLRHLDRGSGEPDRGQYERRQYVFGASGAAALYRRRMLEDVAVDGEYFDEDFFAYREDADLAWRAQLLGWKCLYTPSAVATHGRKVLPERRGRLPAEINMHSVKNRFLLRIKNQTLLEFIALLIPSGLRDIQVVGYVVLVERSSLPGLIFVARNIRRIWKKRRQIMSAKKVGGRDMLRWFRLRPVAHEAKEGNAIHL